MGKQRDFEQVAADAGAAAAVAEQEAPAANGFDPPALARHEGRACADDCNGAVMGPKRAVERNQRVILDHGATERQYGLQPLGIVADIGAGEAEHGIGRGQEFRIHAGLKTSSARGLDDVVARTLKVRHDVGRAAGGAAEHLSGSRRQRRPAARPAAIDAEHQFHCRPPQVMIPIKDQ